MHGMDRLTNKIRKRKITRQHYNMTKTKHTKNTNITTVMTDKENARSRRRITRGFTRRNKRTHVKKKTVIIRIRRAESPRECEIRQMKRFFLV